MPDTGPDTPIEAILAAYVEQLGPDDDVDVEALCAAHPGRADELRRAVADWRALAARTADSPGEPGAESSPRPERIGSYQILGVLGEGGMGTVFVAEQREPVRRRVALKVIKLGMDSEQVLVRFEAERQALARMNHDSIARVYEAGTTERGQPFFAMEYVEGLPLTDYCDRHKLTIEQRVDLFRQVCAGVQHAHQKGVIHRDLKPNNVLVTRREDRAVSKIIDFGLARATDHQLIDRTLFTEHGQILGTPEYMSPEQAGVDAQGIDTRTDIYSLGVMLYELLAGELPFSSQELRAAGILEIQRKIREDEPPKPSARVSTLGDATSSRAGCRRTSAHAWARRLRGDLDWIVLKAIAKEPERRYESASGMAADLGRFLDLEPVLAGRPSAVYRLRKFVRRNRVGIVASVLIAAGVVAGIVGVVSGRLEAIAQRPQVDLYRARQLVAEADRLWPAVPAMIPAMESWLVSAAWARSAYREHRAALGRMRERALPPTSGGSRPDRAAGPDAVQLADLEWALAYQSRYIDRGASGMDAETAAQSMQMLALGIAALKTKGTAGRGLRFETDAQQVRHDLLATLVETLEVVVDDAAGLLGAQSVSEEHGWSVPRRLAVARRLRQGFAEGGEHALVWDEKLPAIRAAYPGLNLTRQIGLVPLGPDPASGLWEFWHVASGARPARGSDGRVRPDGDMGLVLVLIPGGVFTMGAQSKDPNAGSYDASADDSKESPPHEVSVSAFFLSKYEMTQGQWERATGTNPNTGQPRRYGLDKPVNEVCWTECDRVTRRLGLRLPHEEQWEYAAHGPDGHPVNPWPSGNPENPFERFANINDRSVPDDWKPRVRARGWGNPVAWDDGFGFTAPVGSLEPNPFGLHNLYGNVTEMCSNSYYDYRTGVSGPRHLDRRMGRGGHFWTPAAYARPAFRAFEGRPDFQEAFAGLRPARDIDP